MADNNQPPLNFEGKPAKQQDGADKLIEFIEKFRALPQPAQIGVVVGAFFFVLLLSSGGEDPQVDINAEYNERAASTEQAVQQEVQESEVANDGSFDAVDPTRASLQRGFYTQQRKEIAELKDTVTEKVDAGLSDMSEIKDAVTEQQRQMQQMIDTFNSQIRAFEESNVQQRNEIARLVDQARQQEMRAQAVQQNPALGQAVEPKRKKRISQTSLGGSRGTAGYANPNQALLNFSNRRTVGAVADKVDSATGYSYLEDVPEPFLPPLGFVKATLLNGFDALVGRAVPSLVRFQGSYRTAMNSTVSLDGCVGLMEFEGEVSTERAIGKPSRMTCVYPDRGAVTYELTGYVVDAQDGIVGVPGIFYEGDSSRVVAAMAADFAAGIGAVVRENQFTEETSEGGTARNLTGSAVRAELASGVQNLMESLRDYLFERANRVVPFVRIDATRDIHVVLLSGIELRDEGSPWTMLVSGERADAAAAANLARQQAAEEEAKNEQSKL